MLCEFTDLEDTNTRVVYHLQGETSLSTVCANGKQKCLMVSSVRIGHLPLSSAELYKSAPTPTILSGSSPPEKNLGASTKERGHVPLTHKNPIYRKRLERVQPDPYFKIVANGKFGYFG